MSITLQAPAHQPTGDLSAVAAFTDHQLAVELADAQARFSTARVNDPRRAGLAYHDSKLAVQILSAEQRRRAQLAAANPAPAAEAEHIPAGHACDPDCIAARSHVAMCECHCGGANHGAAHLHRLTLDAPKPRPRRDPFAGLTAPVDDLFAPGVTFDPARQAFTHT